MESDRGLGWLTRKDKGGKDGTLSKGFGGEGACLYFRGGTDGHGSEGGAGAWSLLMAV